MSDIDASIIEGILFYILYYLSVFKDDRFTSFIFLVSGIFCFITAIILRFR